MARKAAIVVLLALLGSCVGSYYKVKPLGVIDVPHAAFTYLIPDGNTSSLYITSFDGNPFASHAGIVYQTNNIGSQINTFSQTKPKNIFDVNWPNSIKPVPESVFGKNYLAVAGGFLVPPHNTGQVHVFDAKNPVPIQITTDEKNFFYHEVSWIDMNQDGKLDMVAAKAQKGIFGAGSGKLVWYEQPQSNPLKNKWIEHALFDGPDVYYEITDLNKDGFPELFAAQFFGKSALTLNWVESGKLSDPSSWKHRIIDDTLGPVFDLQIVDLNGDGRPEILATNHVGKADKSGVFAYEIPDDWAKGTFKKHVLATNIPTLQGGPAQASPGTATAFRGYALEKVKPMILVAGDGAQKAFLLTPKSQDVNNWDYELEVVIDVKNTVGRIAVGDTNGDGYAEFFVPNYDGGKVYAFTFAQ
eukprot:Colp12_sorted_trinity150504_noHs@11192